MAGKKISELTALGGNFADDDIFEISQEVGGSFVSRKITGLQMKSSIPSSLAIGDTITSATQGSVLFAGAAGVLAQDNANFFWDDTNNRLGLGTATPAATFDLSGTFNAATTTYTVTASAGLSMSQMSGGGDLSISTGGGGTAIARVKLTDDLISLEAGDWSGTPDPQRARIILDGQSGGNGKIAILGGDLGTPAVGEVLTAKNTDGELEWAAAGGGGASVLGDLTDVGVLGTGATWSVIKNATTPDGAPNTGTFSGGSNFAFSPYALYNISSGSDNVAIGYQAGFATTTGQSNISLGTHSGRQTQNGSYNISIGRYANYASTAGTGNVAIGQQALFSNTGDHNIHIGYSSSVGTQITSGDRNIVLGYGATVASGTADFQFAIGTGWGSQGAYLLSGDFATAGAAKLGINLGKTGSSALNRAPVQPTATLEVKGQGTTNATTNLLIKNSGGTQIMKLTDAGSVIAIGLNANKDASTDDNNIALGDSALYTSAGGDDNFAAGYQSQYSLTDAIHNVAIGNSSLRTNATGDYNIAIGRHAGYALTGNGNTIIGGYNTGNAVSTGTYNTILGYQSGDTISTGSKNITIGYRADAAATASNQIAIGDEVVCTGADQLKIGSGAVHPLSADLSTGAVTINNAFTLPVADGGANQVLQTDGAGAVSWATAGGGATELNGLTDAKVQASSGSALQYSIWISNGSSANAAAQTGTLSDARANLGIGPDALKSITSGDYNIGLGYRTLQGLTSSTYNIAIGYNAGTAISTGTGNNTLVGSNAGSIISTGTGNCAFGSGALGSNSTGGTNVAIGQSALYAATYRNNIGIGRMAGYGITTGQGNTAVGYNTMYASNTNSFCVVMGYSAEPSSTSVSREFTLGYSGAYLMRGTYATAGQAKLLINETGTGTPDATLHIKGQGTTSSTSSFLVEDSGGNDILKITDDKRLVYTDGNEQNGYVLTSDANGIATWQAAGGGGLTNFIETATSNFGVGSGCLDSLTATSGNYNTGIGVNAGTAVTTGDQNVIAGWNAANYLTTGGLNVVIGAQAAASSNCTDLTESVIIGQGAALYLDGGVSKCVYIGRDAALGGTNSTGDNNVGIGHSVLRAQTTGNNNAAIGYQAGYSTTTGYQNSLLGYAAGYGISTGYFNVVVGRCEDLSEGIGNTLIGHNYGTTSITTGDYNVIIGHQALGAPTVDKQIAIGYGAEATTESTLVLGESGKTLLHGDFATASQTKLGINLGTGYVAPTATLHVKGQGATTATTSLLVQDSAGESLMRLNDDGQGIAIGHGAGGANAANVGGNICIGKDAMNANGTGFDNVYIGVSSGFVGNAGWRNVALGNGALRGKTGNYTFYSTAIGYYAMYDSTSTGAYTGANTAVGTVAGKAITSGVNNLCLGTGAGYNLTTGSNNIFIGPATSGINSSIIPTGYVAASSASVDNEINIGGQLIGSMAAADRYTKFTGQVYTPTSTLTDGATITPDFTNGNVFTVTLAGNRTLANPTNPKDGATYIIIVKQDGTGSRTLAYGGNYKWEGGTAPTLSTGANAVDILTFVSDGTNMYGTKAQNFS